MGLEKWCVKTSPEEGRSTFGRSKTLRTKRHMPHRGFWYDLEVTAGVCVFIWIQGLAEADDGDANQ